MSLTTTSLFLLGLAFEITPGSAIESLDLGGAVEIELFRIAGLLFIGLAVLLGRKRRKGITDPGWGRITIGADVGIAAAALYFVTGQPLWLVIGFSLLFAITCRVGLRMLEVWSDEVRTRAQRRYG
jgi:LPXTG-motif cell wall-anchored protein